MAGGRAVRRGAAAAALEPIDGGWQVKDVLGLQIALAALGLNRFGFAPVAGAYSGMLAELDPAESLDQYANEEFP